MLPFLALAQIERLGAFARGPFGCLLQDGAVTWRMHYDPESGRHPYAVDAHAPAARVWLRTLGVKL